MFEIIQGLPDNVIGLNAIGTITDEDYANVLIPHTEKVIREKGKARMLMRFGPDFTNYTMGAMWDDAHFGLKHLREFEKLAVVSDVAWLRNTVTFFSPFIPAPVRVFSDAQLEQAKTWIAD